MAPRRYAPKTLAIFRAFLLDRDGPLCRLCRADPSTPLELDHIDPDAATDHPKNWQLLCNSCNLSRRRRTNHRGIVRETDNNSSRQLSLDDVPESSPTSQAKSAIPYADGSSEMRASAWFEGNFRAWLAKNLPIPKSEAVNGGAEAVGCSPETATRYLAKLTSIAGPLTQEQDAHGVQTIRSKKEQIS